MRRQGTILAENPYVQQRSAKQIVDFANKALLNRQPTQEPSLLQSNNFTANPVEIVVEQFVQLCQKIVNECDYLSSNVDYHRKNQPLLIDEEPDFGVDDIYGDDVVQMMGEKLIIVKERRLKKSVPSDDLFNDINDELISPVKAVRAIDEKNVIIALQNQIQKYQDKIKGYNLELDTATSNKRIRQILTNIRNNEEKLEKAQHELDEMMSRTGSGMVGGAKDDTRSNVIKVANDLIYLLGQADLYLNTKLFPVGRILNPLQKETLRRVFHELGQAFRSLPRVYVGNIDEKLDNAMSKFLADYELLL